MGAYQLETGSQHNALSSPVYIQVARHLKQVHQLANVLCYAF